ncbi:MAG: hypothetical protein Kow0096_25330 [Thiohalomonadaceae bacterium]
MTMPTHYYLARLTLECATPLSIGTGRGDGVFDVQLVTDANGLPAIPGTTLAGVLRHLFKHAGGNDDLLFGHTDKTTSQASRLEVSWGVLCDSHGRAADGLLLNGVIDDPLLQHAADLAGQPLIRDRVRITHRGAAADKGKFDRSILPAGYRFAAELALWGTPADGEEWQRLLSLLNDPAFRLGGATRAGLGAMKVIACHTRTFDLASAADAEAFRTLGRAVDDHTGLDNSTLVKNTSRRVIEFELKPNSYWRIGQGNLPQCKDGNGKTADLLPRLEQRVLWNGEGKGELVAAKRHLLVPAASIKGALSHRVAFHYNRFSGQFAEDMADAVDGYDKSAANVAVRALFGYARGATRDDAKGKAGCLLIDDVYLDEYIAGKNLQQVMHNAIDRFTGGVRNHMLFSEKMVWQVSIPFKITVLDETVFKDQNIKRALDAALADLCEGRLALGGGAGKGHGFFTGIRKDPPFSTGAAA